MRKGRKTGTVLFLTAALCTALLCSCQSGGTESVASEPAQLPATPVPSPGVIELTVQATPEPEAEPASILPAEHSPEPSREPASAGEPEPTPEQETVSEPEAAKEPEAASEGGAVKAGERTVRTDLSKHCGFSAKQKNCKAGILQDDSTFTSVILADHMTERYSWEEDVPADALYWFTYVCPDSFTVTQEDGEGNVLSERDVVPERMCGLLTLEPGCRAVTVKNNGRCKLNALKIFSAGDTLPRTAMYWTEQEDEGPVDLMLFSAHIDDEILMMGGVLPTYSAADRDCMLVYMKGTDEIRILEGLLSTWEMGVNREPYFCRFEDLLRPRPDAGTETDEDYHASIAIAVKLMRQYKPLVVVTHDFNGEYGHHAHIETNKVILTAAELAADPTYSPETAEQYGTWQVQKVYIHLYGERKLSIPIEEPLEAFGGLSANDVARNAFDWHQSQHYHWKYDPTSKQYPVGEYGLYFTAVGDDSGINDMMEHTARNG